ncbi:gag-pol polyprotein [Gossypium australe]|uniref:Gag-pol polyprotein n=1 Tax=Gossypium australe TaxID=47621 RepID=A0A5B6VDG3_9ROSI|nr:gag-pol polyprotein [Gossypium australe]
MCIDSTNLNKVCPEDSFPLPLIDHLVDASTGHRFMSFMDAFIGYNQILLDQGDQEKTAFITEEWLFCYRVMPFSLKNARATYQRLVNRIFKNQIGNGLEVYVDDMLVKSGSMEQHVRNLFKAFAVLRAHNMKLNPKKCAFGVRSSRFLGFMISERGIEVNPDKICAILEMPPLQTIKYIQRLIGRVVALNRFISRMPDKCLPFFGALRTSFSWIEECQAAFEELKLYLTSPLLLKSPQVGETLCLYLATSEETVSAVLVRVEDVRKFPVYYINKTHPFVVMTNQPMKEVLSGADASGRVLADFMVKCSFEKTVDTTGVKDLAIHTDSQLVAKQMNGEYGVKEAMLKKYHAIAAQLLAGFDKVQIKQLPISDNTRANALSKLVSPVVIEQRGKILLEHRDTPSYDVPQVLCVDQKETWMTPIVCTVQGTQDNLEKMELVKLQCKVTRAFAVIIWVEDYLPRKSSNKDITGIQSKRMHIGWFARATLARDMPRYTMAQKKLIVVVVDYFTKWIETEALATIIEKQMEYFLWKSIFCRFEVEAMNKKILTTLTKKVGEAKGTWLEELPGILWALRTTPHTAVGETTFSLVYGTEVVIPTEISMRSHRTQEAAEIKSPARAQQGKVAPNWEGSYKVIEKIGYGAYKLAKIEGTVLP